MDSGGRMAAYLGRSGHSPAAASYPHHHAIPPAAVERPERPG